MLKHNCFFNKHQLENVEKFFHILLSLDETIHGETWEWLNIQGVWACLLTSGAALGPITGGFNPCFFL